MPDMSMLIGHPNFWFFGALAFYSLAVVIVISFFFWRRRRVALTTHALLIVGFAFQFVGLLGRGMSSHACPVNSVFEILHFIGWGSVLFYLIVSPRNRFDFMGEFTACMAVAISLFAFSDPSFDSPLTFRFERVGALASVYWGLQLLAYSVIGLLFLNSVMSIIQNRNLRLKRLNGLFAFLPPIVQLDQMNFRLTAICTLLMTGAIAVASIGLSFGLGSPTLAPGLFGCLLWMIMCASCYLHFHQKIMFRQVAFVNIALFAVVVISTALPMLNTKVGDRVSSVFSWEISGFPTAEE